MIQKYGFYRALDYKTSQYYSWWVDIWSSSSSFPAWFWPRYQSYEI